MRRKAPFDRNFRAIQRTRLWPIRSLGPLMMVVALSGLVLSAFSLKPRGLASGPRNIVRAPATVTLVQGPAGTGLTEVDPPNDRFVIPAHPDIEPAMVIRADPDIDPEMVFHLGPDGRLWRESDVAEFDLLGPASTGHPPETTPSR